MKTGGTMNFLKRAGAILMVVAIFVSSCNKYADDFEQLNTKLDALASQVAGVTQLTTDMTALKAQVSALQTAVAALPTAAAQTAQFATLAAQLTATTVKIDAITTTLNAVAATGTATKAQVDKLVTDLTALTAKITADNKTLIDASVAQAAQLTALGTKVSGIDTKVDALTAALAALDAKTVALQAAVVAVQTGVDANGTAIAGLAAQLTAQAAAVQAVADQITALATATSSADAIAVATAATNAAASAAASAEILAKIAMVETQLAMVAKTGDANDTATSLTIQGLQLMLNAQKAQLDIIVASTAMYNGNVNLTTDAEVDFYMTKLAVLGIINGSVNVDKTNVSAGKLANFDKITGKITAIIGGAAGTLTVGNMRVGDAIDFSLLTSTGGAVTVTGAAKATGADIKLPVLSQVGGTLTLDYDGPYASASISKIGGDLKLVNKAVVANTTPLGTTTIDMPLAVVATGFKLGDVAGVATGIVSYPLATKVILAGDIISLTAAKATEIKLGSAKYAAGLTVSGSATAACTFDISAATDITGAGSITGFGASTVNLAGLKTCTLGLTVVTGATGAVTLTSFNDPAVTSSLTVTGPKVLELPAMEKGAITSTTAETVTLAKHDWAIVPTIGAVKTLSATNVFAPVVLPATTVTATISGKVTAVIPAVTTAACSAGAGNAALTSVTLGGTLATANFTAVPNLATVVTSGVVNSFTLSTCPKVAGMTLAHKHYEGSTGSVMVVTGNAILTSLTTSCDEMATLTVTGNPLLTSCNFASYVTTTVSGNPTITINTNKLSAAYTAAIAATITTPYVEATLTSADIATLKAYIALYTAPVLAIDLDAVKIGAGVATTLSVKMLADAAAVARWTMPVLPALPGSLGGNDNIGGLTDKIEVAKILL